MKINFSFYFLLFIFSFNSFNLSYIVIPFKTNNKEEEINKKSEFNITKFYENNFRSQIYASINIGTPQKIIPINLLMNSQGLIIGYLCNINSKIEESKYDINTSSSFYSDQNNRRIYYNYYKDSFIGQDSFSFYRSVLFIRLRVQRNEKIGKYASVSRFTAPHLPIPSHPQLATCVFRTHLRHQDWLWHRL